jgi:hypothetical protein
MLTDGVHPGAPETVAAGPQMLRARAVGFLGFIPGLYALLAAVGCSGWLKSRAAGIATSVSAGVTALLATWAIAGF